MVLEAEAKFKAASIAYNQGDFVTAVTVTDEILAQTPDEPNALYLSGLSHMAHGNEVQAKEVLLKALQIHPQKYLVLVSLADLERRQHLFHESISLYIQALEMERAIPNAQLGLGLAYKAIGKLQDAEAALKKALSLRPGDPVILNNLAGCLNQNSKSHEAIIHLDKALKARPGNAISLNNRSQALLRQGRVDEALKDGLAAAKAAPANSDVVANYARVAQRAGQMDDAIRSFVTSLRLNPGDLAVHRELNDLLFQMGRKEDFLVSFQFVDRALITPTRFAELLVLRGNLAFAANEMDIADQAADELLKSEMASHGYLLKAKLFNLQKDYAGALKAFGNAMDKEPDNVTFMQECAVFFLGNNDAEKALGILQKDVSREHQQRQIALRATAFRIIGDARYNYYYDLESFVGEMFIDPPGEYNGLEDFLDAIQHDLRPLFATQTSPVNQTLFGGVQSHGDLWETNSKALLELKAALLEASRRYVADLPDIKEHPFLVPIYEKRALEFAGAWAVKLINGGGHVDHFHPEGWISAVHYVAVPEKVAAGQGKGRAGWLRFGCPAIDGLDLPAERYVKPEPGKVVFFPSYIWHGVEPFHDQESRITTPFDLVLS